MHNRPEWSPHNSPVFITGATGFIGQQLTATLLAAGYRVYAQIRPDRQHDERLPPTCQQVPVDLTDSGKLTGIVDAVDAVIYCAGSVRGRRAADFARANIDGVSAMARALESSTHTPPLLLLSSLAASHPSVSDYAYSKNAGEKVLLGRPSLPWTIFRPPAVYGPGDKEMLPLLRLAKRGFIVQPGPREQRLSLLHVQDLARAVETWLTAPEGCFGETYAIDDGTPGGYDWEDIARAVSQRRVHMIRIPRFLLDIAAGTNLFLSSLLGYAPMLTRGKVRELVQPEWLCDNRGFTAATGWRPQLDLELGAQQLFASPDHNPGA
jgi:nucleoside-diphosphate-sugar epimerase